MEILELKNTITKILLETQWMCLIVNWRELRKEIIELEIGTIRITQSG